MTGIPHTIESPRLVLRPWRIDDVDTVFAYSADPKWARFDNTPNPFTRRHAEEFIARKVLADPATHASWGIEHAGALIGKIGLRMDAEGRIGELGYSIARAWWGRGMATEAARAVIDAAFKNMPILARIRASADTRNHASLRVLEKVGMTREGLLRGNRYIRDEAVDEVCFGVLRDEWRGRESTSLLVPKLYLGTRLSREASLRLPESTDS